MGETYRTESELPLRPQWEKGPIERELDELPGHSKRLGFEVQDFINAYERADLIALSDQDWDRLENCDSRGQTWDVQAIEDYRGHARDVRGIEQRMRLGQNVFAPIVLFREGKNPYLIGGNTRLMLCRALNVRPKVVAVRL